jgi:hypothetical protein
MSLNIRGSVETAIRIFQITSERESELVQGTTGDCWTTTGVFANRARPSSGRHGHLDGGQSQNQKPAIRSLCGAERFVNRMK